MPASSRTRPFGTDADLGHHVTVVRVRHDAECVDAGRGKPRRGTITNCFKRRMWIDHRHSVPPSVLLSSFLGAAPLRERGFGGGGVGSLSPDAGFEESSKRQGRSGWWR